MKLTIDQTIYFTFGKKKNLDLDELCQIVYFNLMNTSSDEAEEAAEFIASYLGDLLLNENKDNRFFDRSDKKSLFNFLHILLNLKDKNKIELQNCSVTKLQLEKMRFFFLYVESLNSYLHNELRITQIKKSFLFPEDQMREFISDIFLEDKKEEVAEQLYTLQECMQILKISKRTFQLRRKELGIQEFGERPKRISETDLKRLKEYDRQRSKTVVQTFNLKVA